MRGGEFTRLATPRPLNVTVGGTRARVLARARVPRGGSPGPARVGQTRPHPLFPSPSSAPPHPDSRMRRGNCYLGGRVRSLPRGETPVPPKVRGKGPRAELKGSQPRDPRPPTFSSSSSPSRPSLAGREGGPGLCCNHACPGTFSF